MSETEITVSDGGAPDTGSVSPAVDEAARANAAAQAASDAAHHVAALAQVEAANVAQAASAEISSYEERLNECRDSLGLVTQSQSSFSADLAELRSQTTSQLAQLSDQMSSILARLETPQASPSSPEGDLPAAEDPPTEATIQSPEPVQEVKKRAHRWI